MPAWVLPAAAYAWVVFASIRACRRKDPDWLWLGVVLSLLWPLVLIPAMVSRLLRSMNIRSLRWWLGIGQRTRHGLSLTALEEAARAPEALESPISGSQTAATTGNQTGAQTT